MKKDLEEKLRILKNQKKVLIAEANKLTHDALELKKSRKYLAYGIIKVNQKITDINKAIRQLKKEFKNE